VFELCECSLMTRVPILRETAPRDAGPEFPVIRKYVVPPAHDTYYPINHENIYLTSLFFSLGPTIPTSATEKQCMHDIRNEICMYVYVGTPPPPAIRHDVTLRSRSVGVVVVVPIFCTRCGAAIDAAAYPLWQTGQCTPPRGRHIYAAALARPRGRRPAVLFPSRPTQF
jgi:hypothetical protein